MKIGTRNQENYSETNPRETTFGSSYMYQDFFRNLRVQEIGVPLYREFYGIPIGKIKIHEKQLH